MFDVGSAEVAVVIVVALVVLGPERLQETARTLGFFLGRSRAILYSLQAEMERELAIREKAEPPHARKPSGTEPPAEASGQRPTAAAESESTKRPGTSPPGESPTGADA